MPRINVPQPAATILLVDDDATVRGIARSMLLRQGHRVLEASGGTEALEVLRFCGHEIDILVTDVNMPGMSGPALVEAAAVEGRSMPVLYITGSPNHPSLEPIRSRGNFFMLVKPFTGETLCDAVARAVRAPGRSTMKPSGFREI
jgi:DNA-binding NtrC family response regulator